MSLHLTHKFNAFCSRRTALAALGGLEYRDAERALLCEKYFGKRNLTVYFSTNASLSMFTRYDARWRRQMFERRKKIGPELERHRNIWPNWNLDAELYAFGQRIGETFSDSNLRLAFIHPSFSQQIIDERKHLGLELNDPQIPLMNHVQLREQGKEVVEKFLPALCRYNYPYLPEEAIFAVTQHLCQVPVLATISRHLGTHDLIKCTEFPVSDLTLRDTLLAIIGSLSLDASFVRAGHFVMDFIFAGLLEKDINELYVISNPMKLLSDILQREGRHEPEPRLIGRAGETSLVSVFSVGIYCNKNLIGQGFGETVMTAEDMAARNALQRLFKTTLHQRPLILGDAGKAVDYKNWSSISNVSLSRWTTKTCEEQLYKRTNMRLNESDKVKIAV